jgi:hypothetical protein
MLTFSGFASTDDEQLYSALTANLAHRNGYSALPLFGNDRLQGRSGGVEPMHPIFGIPLYLLAEKFGLGKVQVLYLLPAIYTALTAVLLVVISEIKGYRPKTSLVFGLIYGLCTITFPYARSNFREPLAALLITTAVLFSEKSMAPNLNKWRKFFYSAGGTVTLILAILTKITTAILIPFLIISFFAKRHQLKNGKISKTNHFIFIGILLAVSIGLFFGSILPNEGLSRFTTKFVNYILYTLPRIPHDHFWSALAGLLLSPGKGLFMYSPILVLALINPFLRQKKGFDWIFYLGALLALACVQALIYDDHWWSISWGTRALLPAIPLVCLTALPVINTCINSRKNLTKFFFFLLIGISGLIQIGRLLTADPVYANWAVLSTGRSITSDMLWDLRMAPMIRHWQLTFSDYVSDIAWSHINWQSIPTLPLIVILTSIGLLTALSYLAIMQGKKTFKVSRISVILVIIFLLMPAAVQFDQRYNRDVFVYKKISDQICEITQADDLVLIDAYLTPFWVYYSNFGCGRSVWVGLPYLHLTAINNEIYYPRISDIQSMVQEKLNIGKHVFLIQAQQEHRISYSEEFAGVGFIVKLISSYENPGMHIFTLR